MTDRSQRVWVVAASAIRDGSVGAAVLLKDGNGRCVGSWQSRTSATSPEQGALLAIVEGLRQAKANQAREVTVLCPFPQLTSRLNRHSPTSWNEPLARLWALARARSHSFATCAFQDIDAARARGVIRMAATSAEPALAKAA